MASATQASPIPRAGPRESLPGSAPDWRQPYGLGHGFAYRREDFGGILYHYEGIAPDPRVTFVDNTFLMDLLDALQSNPGVPLGELVDAVVARFDLDGPQRTRIESFFESLTKRGALVPG